MLFLTCLDCRIQADDVVFRQKGKGSERPNRVPRCEACVLGLSHKKQVFRRDPDNQHLFDRQPKMMERKARRQERDIERDMEQRKSNLIAEAAAKTQAYKKTAAQLKKSTKQAKIDRKAYIKSIHDAIVAKYCAENPDFTPGVARDGYAF